MELKRFTKFLVVFLVLSGLCITLVSYPRVRTAVRIPDIPGYMTLMCDFHIHTVFSDGSVWPSVRPEEAWREGLDAIAITDHIEYQPHKDDLPTNHERSYQIAKPVGDLLDVIVIRGAEVTRDMPPGHLNAIFLEQVNPVDKEEWFDALKAADDQKAFIFWNHPGWSGQQKDGIARWYPEHSRLIEEGMLHGVEVVNSREYYPEAHQWCLDKKLTMMSTSDIHAPLNLDYAVASGDHRPMTLIFAKERSPEGIREALFARRTAVYSGNILIGEEKYLAPIFKGSVRLIDSSIKLTGDRNAYLQIKNWSDIDYELRDGNATEGVRIQPSIKLAAGKTVLLSIRGVSETRSGEQTVKLEYMVENLKITPEQGLPVEFEVDVTFVPEEQ